MLATFVHRIDPVLLDLGGVYLWWYGLAYALGFLAIYLWLRVLRAPPGFRRGDALNLSLCFALGVLIGGRLVEVFFYEWSYYSRHPWHIPAYWLGGMSTHGLLLGGTTSVWLFCRATRRSFLRVADALVIPAAFLLGVGRIGNFIDGQIVGALTDLPWGVSFPDLDGFRHPVVLYDGAKNLLLVPLLLFIRRRRPKPGMLLGHFVLWYGFLRIFADLFREYRTDLLLGIPPGQVFNGLMAVLGLLLIVRSRQAPEPARPEAPPGAKPQGRLARRATFALFVLVLLFSLTMPSDWTQDVPRRYGKRHPGLKHSAMYPPIPRDP